MERKLVFSEFDVKADKATGERIIAGYASTFGNIDRQNEVVEPGAFTETLKEYMKNPIVSWLHQWDKPIGKVVEASTDNAGLKVKIKLTTTALANEIWQLITDGIVKSLSIGYDVVEDMVEDGVRYLKGIKLYEVSLVPIPANPDAVFALAKSLSFTDEKAQWTAAFINNLPDAAFAYITPGMEKDDDGKTVPRSARYLPHHNASVTSGTDNDSVDLPHLRNAMARVAQTDIPAAAQKKALAHLQAHAKTLGVGEASLTPDTGEKAGAVLSAKNKGDLAQAQTLIQNVLDSAEPKTVDSGDMRTKDADDKPPDPPPADNDDNDKKPADDKLPAPDDKKPADNDEELTDEDLEKAETAITELAEVLDETDKPKDADQDDTGADAGKPADE